MGLIAGTLRSLPPFTRTLFWSFFGVAKSSEQSRVYHSHAAAEAEQRGPLAFEAPHLALILQGFNAAGMRSNMRLL